MPQISSAIIIASGLAKDAQYLVTHDKELNKTIVHLETIKNIEQGLADIKGRSHLYHRTANQRTRTVIPYDK